MKKLFFCLFVLSINFVYAQKPAKYWIQFKDKQNNGYSIQNPDAFLSTRAITKRNRFNIPITEQDLPLNKEYILQVLNLDTTMLLLTQSKWLNGITVYCEKENVLSVIQSLPFVSFAEKTIALKEKEERCNENFQFRSHSLPINLANNKKDTCFSELDYGKTTDQIRLHNVHWLHRLGYRGEGMWMCVLDGGFNNVDSVRHFELLRQENRLLGIRNFVQPCVNPLRKHNHGTYVLSCIASEVPGEMIGTAPKVSVFLAQTEDGRTEHKIEEDNWVAALEWADSLGCDVINSSVGYTKFDDSTQKRTKYDLNGKTSRASQAASLAASKGIIVCNSAGNAGRGPWKYIGCPADATDIITVGAVDMQRNKTDFSSIGPTADARIKPDVCALGKAVYIANPYGKSSRADGTSFSSPLLAGMLSCLWQAFPEKTAFQVMDAIRKSASQAETPDSLLGYGIVDLWKAYNLLLQPTSTYDSSGNLLMTVTIPSFVYQYEPFKITIHSAIKIKIVMQITLRNGQIANTKEYKIKKGKNVLKIKTFPSLQQEEYGFVDLRLNGYEVDYHYVFGIEKQKGE